MTNFQTGFERFRNLEKNPNCKRSMGKENSELLQREMGKNMKTCVLKFKVG